MIICSIYTYINKINLHNSATRQGANPSTFVQILVLGPPDDKLTKSKKGTLIQKLILDSESTVWDRWVQNLGVVPTVRLKPAQR